MLHIATAKYAKNRDGVITHADLAADPLHGFSLPAKNLELSEAPDHAALAHIPDHLPAVSRIFCLSVPGELNQHHEVRTIVALIILSGQRDIRLYSDMRSFPAITALSKIFEAFVAHLCDTTRPSVDQAEQTFLELMQNAKIRSAA